jgi:hypothetical protein
MQGAVGATCRVRLFCAVLTAAAPFAVPHPLLAQTPESTGTAPADKPTDGAEEAAAASSPRWLTLNRLDAFLELKGEYTTDRVETDGLRFWERDRRQTQRSWSFEERLGLSFDSTWVDPSFLTLGGEVSFALTQSRFRQTGDFGRFLDEDTGHLLTFDLRADLFTGQKLSGSVYGLRRDDRIDRRFQPSLDERRTGFGTSWYWADDTLPMRLSYDYTDTDRTGNADRSDDEHFVDSVFRYGADWNIDTHHRLKFSYEHSENQQEFQGARRSFETSRDLFTIEHQLEFGGAYEHELRTLIHWQEESGDFARDLLDIGPQLTLRHSDTLQTIYKYQFNRQRYDGLDVQTHRADAQLIHQLYSNLTTTVDVFALHEDVEHDVRTTQYGGFVDWQYNRKNPWGHFHANLSLAYDTQELDGDGGTRIVLDEAHTFRDPLPIRLRNRDVTPGSLLVTDTTNRRVFHIGVDFTVVHIRNTTELIRIPTGRIADGDTVLVDYRYRTPRGGQIDTIRVDFSAEQRFDFGLTPYYRLSYRNQEDEYTTGFADRADRTDHHRLGVRYEQKRYALGAEYEIFDDTIDPYDAFHLDGVVHILQSPEHSLDASTRLSRLYFEGGIDDRDVTLWDVSLDHRWRLGASLATINRLSYRREHDSADGRTIGWDVVSGLEYAAGDLSAELTFEYDRLDLPRSDQSDFGVFLRVRREFGDVLARR